MTEYKLFIDDERLPVDENWTIVRTSQEAINVVKSQGIPSFISFDHDLGGTDTSMVFIHWFIEYLFDTGSSLTNFDFYVHSQNPIGKKNIEGLMRNVVENFTKE